MLAMTSRESQGQNRTSLLDAIEIIAHDTTIYELEEAQHILDNERMNDASEDY